MKKAYVKPVFFAEEFVASEHVAGICKLSVTSQLPIYEGVQIDKHSVSYSETPNDNVNVSGWMNSHYNSEMTYWEYAGVGSKQEAQEGKSDAYLFTATNGVCDFLWNHQTDEMGVWGSPDTFVGNDVRPESEMSVIKWLDVTISKFFYGNQGNDDPTYELQQLVS